MCCPGPARCRANSRLGPWCAKATQIAFRSDRIDASGRGQFEVWKLSAVECAEEILYRLREARVHFRTVGQHHAQFVLPDEVQSVVVQPKLSLAIANDGIQEAHRVPYAFNACAP